MRASIYYLPGRGRRLDAGLGAELVSRGHSVSGREIIEPFSALSFSEQIGLVAKDLQDQFWRDDALVIANSFGAYLFLHAQTLLPPFIGKVLLLSPIVGSATNKKSMMLHKPPRAGQLHRLVLEGAYPAPKACRIFVGEDDWQANPESVRAFATPMGIDVTVIPGAGHALDKSFVRAVLDHWIPVQQALHR